MTDAPPTLPYGSWPSPITAASLVSGASRVGELRPDGPDVWWSEQRPEEGGRTQLVRRAPDGTCRDLFPPFDANGERRNWNARTAYLEYGGGAWAVRDGVVVFADWADQRLYRVDPNGDGLPVAISPEPAVARGFRWSEPTWLGSGWLVCARESHEPGVVSLHGEAVNELVAIPVDGSAATDPGRVRVLVSGPDFVHSPAVHGDRVAWIQWDHPHMPWDATELKVGTIVRDDMDEPVAVAHVATEAGSAPESIVQPGFLASGDLVFCTDRSGWWSPWRLPTDGRPAEPLVGAGVEAEIGGPLWVGGLRWWAEVEPGRLLVAATSEGTDQLALVEGGAFVPLDAPFTNVSQVLAGPDGTALVVAGTPDTEAAPHRVIFVSQDRAAVEVDRLRPPADTALGGDWISRPAHVTFASAGGREAHALVYLPKNPSVAAPVGERPPLVVMIHGGPTSAARTSLEMGKQFWTSRGFAVADINHGGSTGYGRPFRDLLRGAWGIVDVEDAAAAAAHLAAEGLVDGERLAIRGGSAGGFTTLAALCFHDVFKAGASHYGVADLTALATDTHKFESRYLDSLVGPWPDARALYDERSPINHTDGFTVPLIVLQGSEDEVVPPNQSEMIVDALAAQGVPHAYLLFEGEQHGFRQAPNIIRALEAELWFYGRVFAFTPADPIERVAGAVGL